MEAAVVGLGALGTPAAWLLADLGWHLRLIDADVVALSNLPRQVLYGPDDVGRSKAAVLAERLGAGAVAVGARIEAAHVDALAGVDLVVDGTDNWASRLVLDAWCRRARVPLLFLSALRWEGQAALLTPDGPCLRCLFGDGQEGPACFEVGLVGPVAGAVAAIGVSLVERWRDGSAEPFLWLVDVWDEEAAVRRVRLTHRPCAHGGVLDVG